MARIRKESKYLFDNIAGYNSKYPRRNSLGIPAPIRQRNAKVTLDQLVKVVADAPYNLQLQLHNFAVDVSIRALTVFRRSFTERRFYSSGGESWPSLTEATIRKRERRGTWPGDGILREYGNLYRSLTRKSMKYAKGIMETVYTDPKAFPRGKAYARIHNDPMAGDTYGTIFGARPVKRRQFLGFSTYIDNFEEKYIDRYLFHAVFGIPANHMSGSMAVTNTRQY